MVWKYDGGLQANHRMMALRMSQCPHHPDDDVEKEIFDLQVMLARPTWTCPSVCKTEPEYVEGIEGILKKLEEPLRVAYDVNPSEARANLEARKEALTKELGVVSKGFRRLSHDQFLIEGLEGNPNVTYVPRRSFT